MKNRFYKEHDCETFGSPRGIDYRTPFQVDRDRIIHTAAFRRLQGKTQVFWSGEYDFYRTRLTHSLEVAQIGKSIANYLLATSDELSDDYTIDADLIEAVCLAHDIGHSPFGHAGERILNELLLEFGGFEGNAQTARLLAETIYRGDHGRRGMSPTRALLDGVLKYKALRSEWVSAGVEHPEHHFLYDEQSELRSFVLAGAEPEKAGSAKVPPDELNRLKSIECQIMDWADDTAYSLHDIADGIAAGFLTATRIEAWAEDSGVDDQEAAWLQAYLERLRAGRLDGYTGRKVSEFLRAVRLETRELAASALSARYRFRLEVNPQVLTERALYGRLARDLIYEAPEVHQLEWKARHILRSLWQVFYEAYVDKPQRTLHLLPRAVEADLERAETESGKARLLCDYLAGMTDSFASRTYKRLFDPDFGSIVDLV